VLVGSQLTVRVPERGLRLGLGAVLMLSGVKLVDPPGANYVIAAGLAAGALALAWWNQVRRPRRLERAREPVPHALD
jgi:hypothetical protein